MTVDCLSVGRLEAARDSRSFSSASLQPSFHLPFGIMTEKKHVPKGKRRKVEGGRRSWRFLNGQSAACCKNSSEFQETTPPLGTIQLYLQETPAAHK